MGTSQSSPRDNEPAPGEVKTSYYELLDVERTATQEELKKAYRKKALQLHPDRNYGDVERTTALFAQVRSAYEVLSDDQERAWYDAHEGEILRGGSGEATNEAHYQGTMRVTTADELSRIMGRFRGNVDFSDSPHGFFGFVRDVFEQLAREEEYAANYEDASIPEYTTFGHKDDQYNDVVRIFYSTWNGFATAKSFAWKDVYRLSDAPDRRTRRLAEKENMKFREDGRREFNEAVRTLVAFVRKRDPRHTPNLQSDDDKAKAQRDARKVQAAKARAAQMARLDDEAAELPSWTTARPADELEDESEKEIAEEHFECVACNKTFKSEKQYEAHERSKKHQKAVQLLKRKMQRDNDHLNLDEDGVSSGVMTPAGEDTANDDLGSGVDSIENFVEDLSKGTEELKVDLKIDESSGKDATWSTTKNGAQSHLDTSSADDDDENDEYATRADVETRLSGEPSTYNSSANREPAEQAEPELCASSQPKMGKAAQKRAKKAARQAETAQSSDSQSQCQGCSASFPSKTQLFQHLKDHPKHVALKAAGAGGKKAKKR